MDTPIADYAPILARTLILPPIGALLLWLGDRLISYIECRAWRRQLNDASAPAGATAKRTS